LQKVQGKLSKSAKSLFLPPARWFIFKSVRQIILLAHHPCRSDTKKKIFNSGAVQARQKIAAFGR
jgi:hypothetical protein